MKRLFGMFLFSMLFLSASGQTKAIASKWNNRWSIPYKVQKGETLNTVAKKFSTTIGELASFNLINAKRLLYEKQLLRIPLTAQNLSSQNEKNQSDGFIEILYYTSKEDQIASICNKFEITEAQFKSWNQNKSDIYAGRELTVGWLKISESVPLEITHDNLKVVKQSTPTPKMEFRQSQSKTQHSETEIQYRKINERPEQVVASTTVPNEEHLQAISYNDDVVQRYSESLNEREDAWGKFKGLFSSKRNYESNQATEPVLIRNDPNRTASGAIVRRNERAGVKQNSKPLASNKSRELNNIFASQQRGKSKAQTRDSIENREVRSKGTKPPYNGMKYNQMAKKEFPKPNARNTSSPNKGSNSTSPIKKPVGKENQTGSKVAGSEKKFASPAIEDKTIRNEIKPLTLTQAKSGTAIYFTNTTVSGKFFVVTNLAAKGTIIKVTNPENGKSLYAEVMSDLPYNESKKGILLKISDNAKLPLAQKSNSFTVKVNY